MSTHLPTRRLTRDQLLATYAGYGRSRERWLIGGEFERHLLDGSGRPAPYAGRHGVHEILEAFIAQGWVPYREGAAPVALTKAGASITLEPGGQFELSGAPHRTVSGIVDEARQFARDVDAVLEGGPYHQVALGFTPYARIPDITWVPKGRYVIMQQHMAASGPLGHHMMKGTAATQASFDFSDEIDCARKVRVAMRLAPLVTGLFANSPLTHGRRNGWKSYRGYIWTQTDPARTGFPEAAEAFTYEAWVDYLLDVPMMFTRSGGVWRSAHGRSFRSWMTEGDEGRFPTESDWDLHITSVFPEARVKAQIEARMADCVSLELSAAFCALFEGLFYCPASLDTATAIADRFGRFGTSQERFLVACKHGLTGMVGGRTLAAWAEEMLEAARAGLSRCAPEEVHWLDPAIDLAQHAECPADRLLAALPEGYSAADVVGMLHPLGTPRTA